MLKPEHEAALKQFTATHGGKAIDQKSYLKANPLIAKTLVARLMSMNPQQQQAVKSVLTPDTADALKVLLPELQQLIDKGIANG